MKFYVVEMVDGIVEQLIDCEDSVEGISFAYNTFARLANENGANINLDTLDEEFWRNDNYSVQLVRA